MWVRDKVFIKIREKVSNNIKNILYNIYWYLSI